MTDGPDDRFEMDTSESLDRELIALRAQAVEPETLDDPLVVGMHFIGCLDHFDEGGAADLEAFVTPESRDSWGDFSIARAFLDSINPVGMASQPKRPEGAPDVAYMMVIPHVGFGFTSTAEQQVPDAYFVTMVWRPEVGLWMVHGFGDPVELENLPRTSPGAAPA